MFTAMRHFRQRLEAGEILIGTGIALTDSQASEALAPSLDFLWIDLEHAAMSPEAMRTHLLAARYKQTPVVVRVAEGSTPFVKNALDSGAPGIIAPQVKTATEVRAFVADCRYPPLGQRGFGPHVPSNYGRDAGNEYIERANRDIFTAVMIETAEAVAAIDEIVAVPGLDSIVIGPWDLSGSLGHLGDVEHPRVVEAMETAINSARAAGLFVGTGVGIDAAYAQKMVQRGVQWLQITNDCGLLVWAAEQLKTLRPS